MKKVKILISVLIAIAIIFVLQQKVEAKSYYIDDMDIEATVLENGDVQIEQTLEYVFNGQYNGIFITIPTQYKNKEEIISQVNDDIYNVQDVELESVSLIRNGSEIEYKKAISATNGKSGVYTEESNSKMYKLKVFSPATNQRKTFKLNYILKNICVEHQDVGELYYNFIGGEWECTIKNLTINIWFPYNEQELKVWGHGPDNGESEIVDNTHIRLKVSNVATGKYVAARVVFDKSNIPYAQKVSNIQAYEKIYEDEQKIAKVSDAKKNYTRNIYIFALILIAYWIILLVIYEKDKKYQVTNIEEDELFEKYNPMLAGCIQGSREVLARDIIAVILNLIDKRCIELEIQSTLEKNENYKYYVKKVPETENRMDEIEKYVYDWLFGGSGVVDLAEALKKMPQYKDANERFKQLNDATQRKLNKKGANKQSVPKFLRIVNTVLFFVVIFVAIKHILYEGFEIYNVFDMLIPMVVIVFSMFPFFMMLFYIPVLLIVSIRHRVTSLIHKITGQKVVTTAVSIIAIFLVIIVLTVLFSNIGNRYIIADEILICIAMVIMLTDNLMLKNNANMIIDYSRLNGLKDKIENSLMEDKDIEQIVLWEKYLAYAVSFGIASKISKRIKQLHIDDDILGLLNDAKINDYITSDYYFFYTTASLDRRFLNNYKKTTTNIMKSYGSGGGSSSGGGGSFSGGGGFSRRRWPRWRRRCFLILN